MAEAEGVFGSVTATLGPCPSRWPLCRGNAVCPQQGEESLTGLDLLSHHRTGYRLTARRITHSSFGNHYVLLGCFPLFALSAPCLILRM